MLYYGSFDLDQPYKLRGMINKGSIPQKISRQKTDQQETSQPVRKVTRDKKAAKAARIKAMQAKQVRKTTHKTFSKERRDKR